MEVPNLGQSGPRTVWNTGSAMRQGAAEPVVQDQAEVVSSVGASGPFFLIDSMAFLAEALLE